MDERYRARDIAGERVDVGPAVRLADPRLHQGQVGGQQAPGVPAQDLDSRGPLLVHGLAPQRPRPGQRAVPVQLGAGASDVPNGRTDGRHADAEEIQVTLEIPLGLPGPLAVGLGQQRRHHLAGGRGRVEDRIGHRLTVPRAHFDRRRNVPARKCVS
jgi:hypothetical protein